MDTLLTSKNIRGSLIKRVMDHSLGPYSKGKPGEHYTNIRDTIENTMT